MPVTARRLALVILTLAIVLPVLANAHPAPTIMDWIWGFTDSGENWDQCRYIQFTWAAEKDGEIVRSREHRWDRYSGDYVVTLEDPDNGDALAIYFNVNTKEGVAYRNDEQVPAEEAATLLEKAYAVFINDSYWLLMPTKLQDYGVLAQYVYHVTAEYGEPSPPDDPHKTGHSANDGHNHSADTHQRSDYAVMKVWFDGVGITPGDRYWLYVDHEGRIVRWDFVLEEGNEGSFLWEDYRDVGMGIELSTRKVKMDGSGAIVFPDVRIKDTVDPSVFEHAAR